MEVWEQILEDAEKAGITGSGETGSGAVLA